MDRKKDKKAKLEEALRKNLRKSVLEDEYNFIKIKLFSELKKIR